MQIRPRQLLKSKNHLHFHLPSSPSSASSSKLVPISSICQFFNCIIFWFEHQNLATARICTPILWGPFAFPPLKITLFLFSHKFHITEPMIIPIKFSSFMRIHVPISHNLFKSVYLKSKPLNLAIQVHIWLARLFSYIKNYKGIILLCILTPLSPLFTALDLWH